MAKYDPMRDIRNPTRKNPLLCLAAGVVFLLIHHFVADVPVFPLKFLAVIGTLFTTLGIAGMADPRLFYGVMDASKGVYPAWVRPASGALVFGSVVAGVLLLIFVYRTFP